MKVSKNVRSCDALTEIPRAGAENEAAKYNLGTARLRQPGMDALSA
jgi:hypothetical protein